MTPALQYQVNMKAPRSTREVETPYPPRSDQRDGLTVAVKQWFSDRIGAREKRFAIGEQEQATALVVVHVLVRLDQMR